MNGRPVRRARHLALAASDRDADGIRDWRWQTKANVPTLVRPGLWLAVWSDAGKVRIVRAGAVCYTRTLQDVELMERNRLPEHKRRKLAR